MTKDTSNSQSPDQLSIMLSEQRAKLTQLHEELVGKRLSNTSEIGQVRKEIARLLTALHKIQ